MAEALSITRGASTISEWERNLFIPPLAVIRDICLKYSINANWLLTGNGDVHMSHGDEHGQALLIKKSIWDLPAFSDLLIDHSIDLKRVENHITDKTRYINRLVEIYYNDKINHLIEFKPGNLQFIRSLLNYKTETTRRVINNVRSICAESNVPLFYFKTDQHMIDDFMQSLNPSILQTMLNSSSPLDDNISTGRVDAKQEATSMFHETCQPYHPAQHHDQAVLAGGIDSDDINIDDLVAKTHAVLKSPTIYRTALASNINAFHQSIRTNEAMYALEARLSALEEKDRARIGRDAPAEDMAEVLRRVAELERKCADLEKENEALKSSGPVDPPAVEAPIPAAIPSTKSTGRKNT